MDVEHQHSVYAEQHRVLGLIEAGLDQQATSRAVSEMCEMARREFGVSTAAVTILNRDSQVIKARAGEDLVDSPRSHSLCHYTIAIQKVLVIPDTLKDPLYHSHPLVISPPFVRFYAGAPLLFRKGVAFGSFCLVDTAPRRFSIGEEAELFALAEMAVSHLVSHLGRRPVKSR
jgi:GAF domain-containing protein